MEGKICSQLYCSIWSRTPLSITCGAREFTCIDATALSEYTYPELAGLESPERSRPFDICGIAFHLVLRYLRKRNVCDVEDPISLSMLEVSTWVESLDRHLTRTYLRLRQAVVDNVHKTIGLHRIAYLRSQLCATFRCSRGREVNDWQICPLHCRSENS